MPEPIISTFPAQVVAAAERAAARAEPTEAEIQEAITEINAGAEDSSGGQWRMGDAVLSVSRNPGRGHSDGGVLARLAEGTGLSTKTLAGYRRVAEAYPNTARAALGSFKAHEEALGRANRTTSSEPLSETEETLIRLASAPLPDLRRANTAVAASLPVTQAVWDRLKEYYDRAVELAHLGQEALPDLQVLTEEEAAARRAELTATGEAIRANREAAEQRVAAGDISSWLDTVQTPAEPPLDYTPVVWSPGDAPSQDAEEYYQSGERQADRLAGRPDRFPSEEL